MSTVRRSAKLDVASVHLAAVLRARHTVESLHLGRPFCRSASLMLDNLIVCEEALLRSLIRGNSASDIVG